MLDDIETCDFFRLVCTDLHEVADNLEEDVRADDGKSISDDDRNDLSEEQVRLAVEQAVSTSRVDFRRSPEARGDRAPGTADAVHTESIERSSRRYHR